MFSERQGLTRTLIDGFETERYLTLVDLYGREVRRGKRGHIPHDLPPIRGHSGSTRE